MLSMEQKKRRTFSETFKREKVSELEAKTMTIAQLSRIYDVSRTAIHRWIHLYGKLKTKGERMVIEKESEAKRTDFLLEKVKQLEQLLGQKQVEIEYLNKVIEFESNAVGEDIKKKYE